MPIELVTESQRELAINRIMQVPLNQRFCVYIDKMKRTHAQNQKLHALIGDIANHFGYTPDEMKTVIKDQLGLYHTIETKKGSVKVYTRTRDMKIDALSDVIEQVYQWAAEHGLVLP